MFKQLYKIIDPESHDKGHLGQKKSACYAHIHIILVFCAWSFEKAHLNMFVKILKKNMRSKIILEIKKKWNSNSHPDQKHRWLMQCKLLKSETISIVFNFVGLWVQWYNWFIYQRTARSAKSSSKTQKNVLTRKRSDKKNGKKYWCSIKNIAKIQMTVDCEINTY